VKKTNGGNSDHPAVAGRRQRSVAGPVENLAEHVPPDWWRKIFNSMYLKTDGDVVSDADITRREIDRFVDALGLNKEDRVLDLCCGHGRHCLELARRGFGCVEGLDRSSYLVQKAKASARRTGLDVRFREGDARKLPYENDTFDAVMIMGNSFGYFEEAEEDLRVLREVSRVLKPWGRLLIDITDGEYLRKCYQPRTWEWIDKKMFVCRERALSADGTRLISREVITRVDRGVVRDQFYAERLYSKSGISMLLSGAGYEKIEIAGELESGSTRGQDLGMMEKRIIVTSVIRKEWSPVKKKRKAEVLNVTVVMGDPEMHDELKPNGVFDDDDIYTIDRLKSALREIDGFRFDFVTSHRTLIRDLEKTRNRTDFVLNLCDEGFSNDPRKELHVPAILESMGIPYTGGGPQCLAFCYDKSLVRGVAKEMDVPVPQAFFIKPDDSSFDLPFPFPAIVKPNFGDSSFGITQQSVCYNGEELFAAVSGIRKKLGYDKPIIVEDFLPGKDLTVGIIGNPDESYTILPVLEEDYSSLPSDLPRICGYEAKWLPDSPYWKVKSVPAQVPEDVARLLEECCLKLFERLECRDYARFDWRLDASGLPRLLEVNPNPGWCWDGHLAKMSGFAGLGYSGMLREILLAAARRQKIDTHSIASIDCPVKQ